MLKNLKTSGLPVRILESAEFNSAVSGMTGWRDVLSQYY